MKPRTYNYPYLPGEPIGILEPKMKPILSANGAPLYAVRYRDNISTHEWTFDQVMKMMRAIPVNEKLEVLGIDGEVHFTLPKRGK